jgi:hypothetical protein
MGEACSTDLEKHKSYMILVGKPERKRPIGGPRCRMVDSIKIDHRDIEWG